MTTKMTKKRKMSRAYCKKTPCRKMGFSQKASCRPYKNCYTRSYKLSPKNKGDEINEKFMEEFKELIIEDILLSLIHANTEDLKEYAMLFTDISITDLDKMTKDQIVESLVTLLKKKTLKCRGARVKKNKEKCQEVERKLFLGAEKRKKEEFINSIQKASYDELIEFYELFVPRINRKDINIENIQKDELINVLSSVFSMLSCQTPPLLFYKTPEEKERILIETERIKQRCKESKKKLEYYKHVSNVPL